MPETAGGYINRNPFPGLRPFRPDEKHLFFGRENQVDRMVDKLAARRFLAVVGTSGSGKSSLVNCGLRPALHRGYMASAGSSWRVAQLRPGSDPIGALARSLAAPGVLFDSDASDNDELPLDQLVEATLRLGSLGLVDIVGQARLPPGVNLLVVVDQFEELFRFRSLSQDKAEFGPAADAVAFVKILLEAVGQSALPIYVVLTMRSDFLGECAQFRGLPEAINESQYLVPRLTRDEIRAAVTGPVSVGGGTISPVLVTRLLNDVGDNPDQLSILQHALNRTWAFWENEPRPGPGAPAPAGPSVTTLPSGPIELPHYLGIGGMQRALDQHAEKAYGELSDGREKRICEFIFRALTDKGTDLRGIRRPTRLGSLCAITGASLAELVAVMDRFRKPSRSFLMPPQGETLNADSVIDISHESLMRVWLRLSSWADKEAESARMYRRVSETAALHAAGKASLWRDPDLSLALDWRARDQPTPAWAAQYPGTFEAAMSFLDASRDAVAAEKVEAEIARRWQAGWNLLPIALVALPFIVAQPPVARWLHGMLVSAYHLDPEQEALQRLAQILSNVVAGLPALVGYILLVRCGKKLLRHQALRSLQRQGAVGIAVSGELERQARRDAISAIEVRGASYALFWRRAVAYLLDYLACLVIWLGVSMVIAILFAIVHRSAAANEATEGSNQILGMITMIFGVVAQWLYCALTQASRHCATPGMRIVGIFITDLAGQPLSFGRATARYFASWLSYCMLIGFLIQPLTSRRQTLHDKVSDSVVWIRPSGP